MKIQKTITIDLEVFLLLREKNLNLSEVLNNYLKEFLNLKEEKKEVRLEKLNLEILKQEADLLNKKKQKEELEKEEIKEKGVRMFEHHAN